MSASERFAWNAVLPICQHGPQSGNDSQRLVEHEVVIGVGDFDHRSGDYFGGCSTVGLARRAPPSAATHPKSPKPGQLNRLAPFLSLVLRLSRAGRETWLVPNPQGGLEWPKRN